MTGFRVTYATLQADDDELHASYDDALASAVLGAAHPLRIGTEARAGGSTFETVSPVDNRVVVGRFATASAADVADAVSAARAAAPMWAATSWKDRVAVLERAADAISARRVELAAHMAWEVGKSRLEALGDVEESADLIRYYTHEMSTHDGFGAADGAARPDRGHLGRDATAWRVGGDQPVQLPDGAARRAGRRGARRRQHGRAEAVRDRLAVRPPGL